MSEVVAHTPNKQNSEQNTGYTVKTEAFEGPLDLLLSLIQKRKLFINDISLAQVTDDYIAHIDEVDEFPVADGTQFIVTASTLMLIKSRSLLPELDLTEEEEGDIEELEGRLRVYQCIKGLSEHVTASYGATPMASGKPQLARTVAFSPTAEVHTQALAASMCEILERLPKRDQVPQTEVKKMVSLKETIEKLTERIQQGIRARFSQFSGYRRGEAVTKEERQYIVINFLAMLELVKKGMVRVTQQSHFDDIELEHTDLQTPRYDRLE